jgi:2-hydroxychromene-2-carboxylate isomerase
MASNSRLSSVEEYVVSERKFISSGSSFEKVVGYSRAVVDGDWIFVSGTTGYDYSTMTMPQDLEGQTRQAFRNISAALEQAGATLGDVVRVRYYLADIPYKMPNVFPIPTQAPARIVYWIEGTTPDKVEAAVLALYRAYFVDDHDISRPETAAEAVAKAGVDPAQALAATNDPAIKERLKNETQTAIERGVFGSPYVIVDGEPFWGMDRFDQVERWLARGGF